MGAFGSGYKKADNGKPKPGGPGATSGADHVDSRAQFTSNHDHTKAPVKPVPVTKPNPFAKK